MKEIPLTQGQFAKVDDADYGWLNQFKWCLYRNCNILYAARGLSTAEGRGTRLMHIDIIGKKSGMVTDHINGDGLDNQRHNLRQVTQRQNTQNLHVKTTSIYPGVDWNKRNRRWMARIYINGKRKYLGSYLTEKEAYMAYCKEIDLIGEILLEDKYAQVN